MEFCARKMLKRHKWVVWKFSYILTKVETRRATELYTSEILAALINITSVYYLSDLI